MLKAIAYVVLLCAGLGATFINPVFGGAACILAYLVNPPAIIGDYVDARFQLWTTVAFAASFLLYRNRRTKSVGHAGWSVLAAMWLFVGVAALSAAWAVVSAEQSLDAMYEVFKTVLMITLVVWVIQTTQDFTILMIACMVGVCHAAVMHTLGIKFGYVHNSFGREFGVLPDGQTPVMVLFLPLIFLTAVRGSTRIERLFAWISLPLVLNSIVSSYMRTGFVSLLVEAFAMLLFLPKRMVLSLLPALAIVGGVFMLAMTPTDYWERVSTILTPHQEASASSRFTINEVSLKMLEDYPMGVGYRNYPDVSPRYLPPEMLTNGRRSAHNSYFSVACETGIIGFTAWISAFVGALFLCRRVRRTVGFSAMGRLHVYALAIEIGLIGWMAGGCFQADHEVDPAYWFVGFAVALTRLQTTRVTTSDTSMPQHIIRSETEYNTV